MTEPTTEPTIRLYDTMRREKVEFRPIDPSCVRMYVCGPTVYDYAHIGNARPAIVFDVLFRLLRHVYGADNVVYVRNITDVDDKIIARAQRDYPDTDLNEAIRHVTETTAKQYQDDMAALGCLPPTHEPRATENIPQMIALVEDLLRNGHAYEATGEGGREVLFDVTSMPDYGALSNRRVEDQRAGARVEAKDHKRNAADFVLWKEAKAGEPGWDSPFGRGRPGWHLECSAMSDRFLWDELRDRVGGKSPHVFDIHGGGIDLTFPHHENEIAQSRCAHGTGAMASVWMHNGYLQLEGRKMSKSEGNFVTIHDLLHTEKFGGRRWPGEVLRLAMLMTHYREPIDFSVRRLEEAEAVLGRWRRSLADAPDWKTLERPDRFAVQLLSDDVDVRQFVQRIDVFMNAGRFAEPNVPPLEQVGVVGFGPGFSGALTSEELTEARSNGATLLHLLGFTLHKPLEPSHEQKVLVERRLRKLANRNFTEADRIRDELAAEGIQLMDYKDPETGERRTTWEVKR